MDTSADSSSVATGVGTVFALHLIQVPFLICCSIIGFQAGMVAPLLIGASQFVYVGPALSIAGRKGWRNAVRGMWIGAGVTFLLNAACWGLVLASFGRGYLF
ncbi:MAG: hypothetical protein HYR85_10005 [Planctomycetes bacterium]|nr:hypothetical protein [Planctomycetota bacterium]MBI3846637.1 hypothetical protein [Planctomycetota bacterium]